ncbi:MAG: hypothetical protein H6673_03925 [Anaerolineales bacterium]|nr:hypothetical protein [Anaerolineales bacterium]
MNKALWLILGAVVIAVTLFLALGLQASDGPLLMPLDDTYIHFQYARQMATGHPYAYNTGDDPTSGSTSFLYTPILAVGYVVGFKGLSLAYWAVLVGVTSLVGSAVLIYRLILPVQPQRWHFLVAVLIALSFALNGPMVWAALSGMETGLFVFSVLLALYAYRFWQDWRVMGAGALASLVRPEGAVIAVMLLMAHMLNQTLQPTQPQPLAKRLKSLWRPYLLLPLTAIAIQPLANLALTGSLTASGNYAKSHLYDLSKPLSERYITILGAWWRLWREVLNGGYNATDGRYIPVVLVILALFAVLDGVPSSYRQRRITPALLVGMWLLLMSAGVATLDTAFWHFKRYQLPLMALMFPLAGWVLLMVKQARIIKLSQVTAVVILLLSASTLPEYARRYADNIKVVRYQQVAMARWVDANLPADARMGVHDVGVMAYVGQRPTYDIVGLTTPDVALAWRQGSGTITDTMLNYPNRPDYFAVYHDIQSLPFLEQAGVFGEELAQFTYSLPRNTAASATATQIVSRPDWSWGAASTTLYLNVGDIRQEAERGYEWWNDAGVDGFISDVRRLDYANCGADCVLITDGGRLINGGEAFDLPDWESDYHITLRVHAAEAARLLIGCENVEQIKVVPAIPGYWFDVAFDVPHSQSRLCVEAEGTYHPYSYFVTPTQLETVAAPDHMQATFYDPDQHPLQLVELAQQVAGDQLQLEATWFSNGQLTHDGKLFIHIYTDPEQQPAYQVDTWVQGIPPANWQAGAFTERYTIEGITAGHYTVALGFYDPNTQTRYTVNNTDRLFVGEIEVLR